MPDSLAEPLDEFLGDLGRLEKLLAIIDQLREFGAVATTEGEALDEFSRCALDLRSNVRAQSTELPILSGTLLLFAAGRFEHFVRVSFEALCDAYAAKCVKFGQLPEKMRNSLVSHTAEVLARPSKYGFDEVKVQAMVHNLSNNMNADHGVGMINSECLSITDQNMHPGMLTELYKRIGITSLWVELSKQARIKMHFELDKDAEVERSAKAALENLMSERNSIAHPNSAPVFPDVQGVKRHVQFLRVLAEVLTDVCRVQVTIPRQSRGLYEFGPLKAAGGVASAPPQFREPLKAAMRGR